LKPAMEPITVARKPLIGTVAENVLQHGTGAINVDGCRVGMQLGDTKGEFGQRKVGIGENNTNGIYGGGFARQDADESKGRWPANFIHDGSDEVVGLFPQSKSTGGNGSTFNHNAEYSQCTVPRYVNNGPHGIGYGDNGSAARFFYCAKASKADRGENHHPTVKPTDLMRYLCKLVTPPDGIVLDPFMGSGSTGKAATLDGFGFIGIEREAEYIAIAEARINAVMTIFDTIDA